MKPFLILLFSLCVISCNKGKPISNLDKDYLSAIEEHKTNLAENRINYLQLIGLFKLDSLLNRFGSDRTNEIIFEVEGLAPKIGRIQQVDSLLIFYAENGVVVKTADNEIVTNLVLRLDEYGSSVRLYHQDLNWQVITRSGQHYLRVWHANNPAVKAFEGFEYFEIEPALNFKGQFTYYENVKSEIVKSEVDGQRSTKFIGYVTFEYLGDTYDLDVGVNGFTMVSDETTGDETYGGGRYIYLDLPETSGPVSLDLNYLYNPPCSFSRFTTCLYPPRQNHLPLKVRAGERIARLSNN